MLEKSIKKKTKYSYKGVLITCLAIFIYKDTLIHICLLNLNDLIEAFLMIVHIRVTMVMVLIFKICVMKLNCRKLMS